MRAGVEYTELSWGCVRQISALDGSIIQLHRTFLIKHPFVRERD